MSSHALAGVPYASYESPLPFLYTIVRLKMMTSVYLDFLALSKEEKAAFLEAIKSHTGGSKTRNKTRKPKRKITS